MTQERFEEIIELKCGECTGDDSFCNDHICTDCRSIKPVKGIALREFWQKIKELNDLSKSQFAELQKYQQAEAERENPQPLTLDEMRQMEGEPVWVEAHDEFTNEHLHGWYVIDCVNAYDEYSVEIETTDNNTIIWDSLSDDSPPKIYRYKPKEDEK